MICEDSEANIKDIVTVQFLVNDGTKWMRAVAGRLSMGGGMETLISKRGGAGLGGEGAKWTEWKGKTRESRLC